MIDISCTYLRTVAFHLRTEATLSLDFPRRVRFLVARVFLLICFVLCAAPSVAALSPGYVWVKTDTVCSGLPMGTVPAFTEPGCKPSGSLEIDPQGTFLWVRATVVIPDSLMENDQPLGLFLSGMAATKVYLNRVFLGQNGTPGITAADETPGRIDAVFALPRPRLQRGENQLIFSMSAHHGHIRLDAPLQIVAVGPYKDPTNSIVLRGYLPSLLPLGILLLGTPYFGALAMRQRGGWQPFLPPLAALFATAQLGAELMRGIISYSYPFHDIRLTLIVLLAAGSGMCLLAYTVWRFVPNRRLDVLLGGLGITALTVYFSGAFDTKAAYALMTPAAISACLAAVAALRHVPAARMYAAVLGIGAVSIHFTRSSFLDVYYYYVVAALLVFLFIQQMQDFIEAKKRQQADQARADRLALALEEAQQKQAPGSLSVKGSGVVEKIPHDKLVYCKGARDYVELLTDGLGQKLHNASLAELEKDLPASFLRVHRSYIVNTAFIDRLEREPSGTGILHLTTGKSVPVSRRIMPTVRKALS